MKLITGGLVAAVLFGLPFCALAASPEPVAGPMIHEQATVNIVNIDAFVTNAAGEPITDLHLGDFELFEGGKPVSISNFFASGATLAGESVTPSGETAAASGTEEQQLLFVLFVDGLNMTPTQRRAVFSRAETIIGQVLADPATRMMVVSGGSSITIRQRFTRDPLLILHALKAMEGESGAAAAAISREAMLRTQIETAQEAGGTGASEFGSLDRESILQNVRSAAQQEYEQTRGAIQSTTAFMGSLGGLPGRKALLYVGGAIRVRPGEALLQRAEGKFGGFSAASEASRFDLTRFINELAARANANGVTIYCIDAGGNRILAGVNATDRFIDSDRGIDIATTLSGQGALQYLARATGGQAVINREDLSDSLSRLAADFRHYYSLGFAAPLRGDGSRRDIKVKVTRPGAIVRTRSAFFDVKFDEQLADRTLAALLFDVAVNPLEIQVIASAEPAGTEDLQKVTVLVTIPLATITFTPKGAAHEATLLLSLVARDGAGRLIQVPRAVFPISVPNDKLLTVLGQNAGYTFTIGLKAGSQRAAVTVRDETGHVMSTAAVDVTAATSPTPSPAALADPS